MVIKITLLKEITVIINYQFNPPLILIYLLYPFFATKYISNRISKLLTVISGGVFLTWPFLPGLVLAVKTAYRISYREVPY